MPPHQFWPRYHSGGLSPVHVRFEIFSKQICNVEALICHFYKNIKTLTQPHFPRDADIFRTCTIFYRHYKGLCQMREDLVLCAHMIGTLVSSRPIGILVVFRFIISCCIVKDILKNIWYKKNRKTFPYLGFGKNMWHNQGEWVTCQQYSILSFQH